MLRSIISVLSICSMLVSCTEDQVKPTLINITDELPGINCSGGGAKIETGIDVDNNQKLTTNEVLQTQYICKTEYDKQIRLEIGAPNFSTRSQGYVLSEYETFHLIKFNKLNFSNVESIIFVPSMYAGDDAMFPNETTTCFVQLFNVTDNVAINNSELQSSVSDFIFKESGNIYNDLPSKEITLGIRIKTTNAHIFVSTGLRSYLFINKK